MIQCLRPPACPQRIVPYYHPESGVLQGFQRGSRAAQSPFTHAGTNASWARLVVYFAVPRSFALR